MVMLFKDAVEIAGIVITCEDNNIFDGQGGVGEQISCLVETFCLQELLECLPGVLFNNFAERIGRNMKLAGNFTQFRIAVILFDIFQDGKDKMLFILGGIVFVDLVGMIQQMQE